MAMMDARLHLWCVFINKCAFCKKASSLMSLNAGVHAATAGMYYVISATINILHQIPQLILYKNRLTKTHGDKLPKKRRKFTYGVMYLVITSHGSFDYVTTFKILLLGSPFLSC